MATISLIGGETALGREVRESLERLNGAQVQMLGATDESTGVLTEAEGEPTFLFALDETRVRTSDVLVYAARDAATGKRAWQMTDEASLPFIDLSGMLEGEPSARLRSPLTEPEGYAPGSNLHVLAHPAASALALLLSRVQRAFPYKHAVVEVFEPASERGMAGITELQNQVSSLLSFRPLEKKVFDAQAAFNMLVRYGDDAPESLADIESRVYRHLASLLAGGAPLPSLRVVQAPVFHGHSFSLWLEFEERPDPVELGKAIASAQVDVRGPDLDPPSNVGVAGQSGVTVGVIEPDRTHPRGLWVWAAADNYQVLADNTTELVRGMLDKL